MKKALDWEGEVVAWIGTPLVDATAEEALAAVVGYSTFNDVTVAASTEGNVAMDYGEKRRPIRPDRADGTRRGGRRPP